MALDNLKLLTLSAKDYVFLPLQHVCDITSPSQELSLVTVVTIPDDAGISSGEWLKDRIERFRRDDVWDPEFLEGICFLSSDGIKPKLGSNVESLLRSEGNKWSYTLNTSLFEWKLHPGPYAVENGRLWEARRLEEDTHQALMVSLIPERKPHSPHELQYEEFAFNTSRPTLKVLVPSRAHFEPTAEQPLAGLRVFVKDNFNLKGVKTSVGNRAYWNLYPPCSQTASSLQVLERKGAQILGKTKLCSFAGREEPTEYVDFQAPFNPRADGYQSPAGSSSGSAAAVAAYDWIDVAVGTDINVPATGSGRRPAHWNGCFALRPTHGLINTDGIVPNFKMFDTPSIFTRSTGVLGEFANAWYAKEKIPPSQLTASWDLTTAIYLQDYIPIANRDQNPVTKSQNKIIDSFLKALEAARVPVTSLSLKDLWRKNPPSGVQDLDINEFLRTAGTQPFFYDDYHNSAKFRADYWEESQKMPYVTPYIRWKWGVAKSITKAQRDASVERLRTYRTWLLKYVLRPNTVVILPIQELFENYRDLPPPKPSLPTAFSPLYMSPIVGAPEIVIPFGHVPYNSRVSTRREYLPCAVSLVGHPNADIMLIELAEKVLRTAGKPTYVETGPVMFDEPFMHQPYVEEPDELGSTEQ